MCVHTCIMYKYVRVHAYRYTCVCVNVYTCVCICLYVSVDVFGAEEEVEKLCMLFTTRLLQ